jgi:hypothetical protein
MKTIIIILSFIFNIYPTYSQILDDSFSLNKMKKDFKIFKNIREKANSGLYKYRSKEQIDSIYNWAEIQLNNSKTYSDFYNILFQITDFEGSLHNETSLDKKVYVSLKKEKFGYFPFPLKNIENKWIVNFENIEIPLGSEIISINNVKINQILQFIYKYETTDGYNITGKNIGINYHFSKYFRFHFGLQNDFIIEFINSNTKIQEKIKVKSIGYLDYYTNLKNRYSKPFDTKETKNYYFKSIDSTTSLLTINTFNIDNRKYEIFLDSTFKITKSSKIKNLIVDIRENRGGQDPNDLVTYSYLTNRLFQENKEAFINFRKIPYSKYIKGEVFFLLKPIFKYIYQKRLKKDFVIEKNGKFYQDENSADHQIRYPKDNAFLGKIYLLISPKVGSAGSLFAAMLAGNSNTTTIGEETMGGYYGHNGHSPIRYTLPNSKLKSEFFLVNLTQDVPKKDNQKFGRGIIPDYEIKQSYNDFLEQKDTQMNFVLNLLKIDQ